MLKALFKRSHAWACAALILAMVHVPAMAQDVIRIDYGTIEAVEIQRAAHNEPVNAGTVLGGIAGGVIGLAP